VPTRDLLSLVLLWSVAALPCACADGPRGPTPRTESMTKKPKGDDAGPLFQRGAALSPAATLRSWLDAQTEGGKPKLVRIPVILPSENGMFVLRGVRIGASDDALTIYANDSLLGIGLASRARQNCRGEPRCAFWVRGHFRGEVDGALQFDVVAMDSHIPADALAEARYAEVEAEHGN
jgi:hypothetical protein